MTLQNVSERFLRLAGLDSAGALEWGDIIGDAFSDISKRVIPEKDTQENSAFLEAAAAALAFYNYRAVTYARQELSGFKAGDLSIDLGDSGVKEAYAFFLRALEPCTELFYEKDFIFGRVGSLCSPE